MKYTGRYFHCGLAFLLAQASVIRAGQVDRVPQIQEPQWVRLRITEVSAGAYAEGDYQETKFRNTDTTATHERLFVGPLVGLNLDGSLYHPNFFRFQANGEGSAGWGYEYLRSGGETVKRDELEWLGRFNSSAQILAGKPVSGSLFANYDHTYRDYDFFSRVIVNSWRYGGRVAYQEGPWNIAASYSRRDEDVLGRSYNVTNVAPVVVNGTNTGAFSTNVVRYDGRTRAHEDVVGFDVRHERDSGGTTFNYTLNQYSREDFGVSGEGTDHSLSLGDNERFGSTGQHSLYATTSYLHRENEVEPSDEITASLNLELEHRPETLWSRYSLNYDRYETGDFTSDNYLGRAELEHRLYQSLTSTLILEGAQSDLSDFGTSASTRRFGGGFQESYVKMLSSSHRLRLDNYFMVMHVETDQEGGIIGIRNERHAFPAGVGGVLQPIFLSRPYVRQFSIVVWDAARLRQFIRGVHYTVRQNGSLTQIVPIPGAGIPIDRVVSIDYDADPSPSGSYETINDTFQIRFDLFNNFWGLYGRVNWLGSNARSDLRVQDLLSFTFGTDVSWRWLRAGAEHEIYDSTFSSYSSSRLFQSVSLDLDERSTLGADFSQTWTEYTDADREEQTYTFISRYRHAFSRALSLNLEGGVMFRRGEGVDQDLATARPGLEWVFGRTTLRAEYNFEYNLFLNTEERYRHMFFVRCRRVF